jgi:mRNA interferase YafQ
VSYEILRTTQFRMDCKRMLKRGRDLQDLVEVLRVLANGEILPLEKRDYALTGNYAGFRECHIAPDWLLVYCIQENQLVLVCARTGTHSDLF